MNQPARRPVVALEPKSMAAPRVLTNGPSLGGELRRDHADSKDPLSSWALSLTDAERRFLHDDLSELTDRERQVVFALCEGGQNQAVAERLYIALPTLRTHLMRINQKLGARSKGDVVRFVASRLLDRYRSGRPMPALITSDNYTTNMPREGEGSASPRPAARP